MTAQDMWDQLCERHPEFADDEHVVRLRARGLRNLLMQAHDEGRKSEHERVEPESTDSILDERFGKFKR